MAKCTQGKTGVIATIENGGYRNGAIRPCGFGNHVPEDLGAKIGGRPRCAPKGDGKAEICRHGDRCFGFVKAMDNDGAVWSDGHGGIPNPWK
jgi:hypothetical protein